ncbi:MAG TPA: 30S ribosome-binding factor RbfA [Gemmataceae bacterium]|nr:30S ribosome-binding factor RbfA [Gemmataceae bacterium]
MKHHRLARVAEAVREAASEAILYELRDPRIKFTTVTRAEVSADLQHAKVYVSVMGSERDRNLTLHGLRSAAGFIQSKLGDRMRTRYVPVLEFVIDEGIKNSLEVTRLLNEEKARNHEREDRGQKTDDSDGVSDGSPDETNGA